MSGNTSSSAPEASTTSRVGRAVAAARPGVKPCWRKGHCARETEACRPSCRLLAVSDMTGALPFHAGPANSCRGPAGWRAWVSACLAPPHQAERSGRARGTGGHPEGGGCGRHDLVPPCAPDQPVTDKDDDGARGLRPGSRSETVSALAEGSTTWSFGAFGQASATRTSCDPPRLIAANARQACWRRPAAQQPSDLRCVGPLTSGPGPGSRRVRARAARPRPPERRAEAGPQRLRRMTWPDLGRHASWRSA